MIRIYLDWNVISNLKRPEFKEILDFISKHKEYLQFPYSPAHLSDLMKSYTPDNELFYTDLDMLQYLAETHLLRWENGATKPLLGTPKEYFESTKDNKDNSDLFDFDKVFKTLDDSAASLGLGEISGLMKSILEVPSGIDINEENRDILEKMFPNLPANSTVWDLIKEIGPFSKKLLEDGAYYKNFRKIMVGQGFKLEANSGNWSYDTVIKNIDAFLIKFGTEMTYLDYIESRFKNRKEPITHYEYYTTAYLLLDLVGYKVDKLPKPSDNLGNIRADGEHSFYAAHCDYFVAIDKKLRIKSKVLYNEFKVSTKIIEPEELISELTKVLDDVSSKDDLFEKAISFYDQEFYVGSRPLENEEGIDTYLFHLPKFYFNYFNFMIYCAYPEHDGFVLTFRKGYTNFSEFTFYTENVTLINTVCQYFGYTDSKELEQKLNEFVYTENEITFDWSFNGGMIRLEREEETKNPILKYFIVNLDKKSD